MIELSYKLRAKVIVCTNNTINEQKKYEQSNNKIV